MGKNKTKSLRKRSREARKRKGKGFGNEIWDRFLTPDSPPGGTTVHEADLQKVRYVQPNREA